MALDRSLAVAPAALDQLRMLCQSATALELAEWQVASVASNAALPLASRSSDTLSDVDGTSPYSEASHSHMSLSTPPPPAARSATSLSEPFAEH